MSQLLSDEPDKAAQEEAEVRAKRARWAFLVWLAAHGDAWVWEDYTLYQETLAAAVMLPDGVAIKVRV